MIVCMRPVVNQYDCPLLDICRFKQKETVENTEQPGDGKLPFENC